MKSKVWLKGMFKSVIEAWQEIHIKSEEALWLIEAFIDEAFGD